MSSEHKYIHGHDTKEQERLVYQNSFLSQFIYENIDLNGVNNLLELGCGVGAQMQYVFDKYKDIHITGVDISSDQLRQAKINLESLNIPLSNYELIHGDATLPLSLPKLYDGLLMVWVLEHVENPTALLKQAKRFLKDNAKICITEVFDSSFFVYPSCPKMQSFWKKSMHLKKV